MGSMPVGSKSSDITSKVLELQTRREMELTADNFIATQPPLDVMIKDYIMQRARDDDTGAGVFGAVSHINVSGIKKSKAARVFTDPDWTEDDSDQVSLHHCFAVPLCSQYILDAL